VLPFGRRNETLKVQKLLFQNLASARAEMASFKLGVVGSSPT